MVTVTPSDTVDLSPAGCRGLQCSTAGNVQVTFAGLVGFPGNTIVVPVNANVFYPMYVTRVWASNASAGTILALY